MIKIDIMISGPVHHGTGEKTAQITSQPYPRPNGPEHRLIVDPRCGRKPLTLLVNSGGDLWLYGEDADGQNFSHKLGVASVRLTGP